jgi:transcriptional regulator with XRE-family HTH domain
VESNSSYFGARLRHLIESKGLGVDEFARDYGISQSQAFNWLKRDEPPLGKHWAPLAKFFGVSKDFLVSGTPQKVESRSDYALAEDPGPYSAVSGFPKSSIRVSTSETEATSRTGKPVRINPAHQPRPPEPTPQACIDYFLTYLKAAEHAPGGVGVAWWKLQKNFPLDEFDPPKKP